MIRKRVVRDLLDLVERLGSIQDGSEWYLYGSVDRNELSASDIDLLILCESDAQADALRRAIDADELSLPLDLSLMTFVEAAQIDAVRIQKGRRISPLPTLSQPPVSL